MHPSQFLLLENIKGKCGTSSIPEAYEDCDRIPNVLVGVENVDMSVEVMGQKLEMPIYYAPTAWQHLFHHKGERAVARTAAKYGIIHAGVSSLATVTVEQVAEIANTPKMFQFYFNKVPVFHKYES